MVARNARHHDDPTLALRPAVTSGIQERRPTKKLYTPQERARRDATVWTLVQGILAPIQFIVFLASLVLVIRYLATGAGAEIAMWSVILKTVILYVIMVTGSIWEKVVFGHYLFAVPFFWEDVVSMFVLALHTAYLVAVGFDLGTATGQMWLALAAYAAYVVNAAQFVWKLRQARLEGHATNDFASAEPSPQSPLDRALTNASIAEAGR